MHGQKNIKFLGVNTGYEHYELSTRPMPHCHNMFTNLATKRILSVINKKKILLPFGAGILHLNYSTPCR